MMAKVGQISFPTAISKKLCTIHLQVPLRIFSFGGNSAKAQPGFLFCVLTIRWNLAFLQVLALAFI